MLHQALFLVLFGLLMAGRLVSAQCTRTQCNGGGSICTGFGYEVCYNSTNNVTYSGNICYMSVACASYSRADGDMSLTLRGASPKQIFDFYALIQTAVMGEYNKFCRSGDNYMFCCPGATSWPNKTTDLATVTAMSRYAMEVPIVSAIGAADSTTLVLRLAPNKTSSLCNAVSYATTTTATTTTTTTKAATLTSSMATGAMASSMATGTMTSSMATGTMTSSMTTVAMTPSMAAGTITSSMAPGTTASTIAGTTSTMAGTTSTMAGTTSTMAGTTSTMAGTTSTMAGTTSTMAGTITSPISTSTIRSTVSSGGNGTNSSATGRRRRRDLADVEERGFDDAAGREDAADAVLRRERRDASSITLPASTVAAIASSTNITSAVQIVLSQNNVTVSVAVSVAATGDTTVAAATTAASAATTLGKSGVRNRNCGYGSALTAVCLVIATSWWMSEFD